MTKRPFAAVAMLVASWTLASGADQFTPLRIAVAHTATTAQIPGSCSVGVAPDILADDTGVVWKCSGGVYVPVPGTGGSTGTGTTGKLPLWTSATTLGDSFASQSGLDFAITIPSSSGVGGAINATAGDAGIGNFNAGGFLWLGGHGSGTGAGGGFRWSAGQGGNTGAGGPVFMNAGPGGTASGPGGDVHIGAGSGVGTNSAGGNVFINPGLQTGSGAYGYVYISNPFQTASLKLDLSGITANRSYAFPDLSGEIVTTPPNHTDDYYAIWRDGHAVIGSGLIRNSLGGVRMDMTAGDSGYDAGGGYTIYTGDSYSAGQGGSYNVNLGSGIDTGKGGSYVINLGAGGSTSGDSGDFLVNGGYASAGAQSKVGFNQVGYYGFFDFTSLTGDHTYGWPDLDGAVTLDAGTHTDTFLPKWAGSVLVDAGVSVDSSILYIYNGDPADNHYVAFDASRSDDRRSVTLQNADGTMAYTADISNAIAAITTVPGTTHARADAQTAANTNILTVNTPASDATYMVTANVLVTTSTLHSFSLTVSYTDEGGTARTLTMPFSQLDGTLITAITGGPTTPYEGTTLCIRTQASSTIVFKTAGMFTSVVYNADVSAVQVN